MVKGSQPTNAELARRKEQADQFAADHEEENSGEPGFDPNDPGSFVDANYMREELAIAVATVQAVAKAALRKK
jgi:hypothetical protein